MSRRAGTASQIEPSIRGAGYGDFNLVHSERFRVYKLCIWVVKLKLRNYSCPLENKT